MPELTTFQELLNNLSKRSFIGRAAQLTFFQHAFLAAPMPTFLVLNVYGQAGVGKSCLLDEMVFVAKQLGAQTAVTNDSQFDISEVIFKITEQLSLQKLQPTASSRLQQIKALSQKLVQGLDEIAQQERIVLFFDNFQTTSPFLESWLWDFMHGEYGRFSNNILFVIASQEPLGKKWQRFGRAIQQIELPPFDDREVTSFLSRANIKDKAEIARLRQESQDIPGKLATLISAVKPNPAGHTESLVKQAYQHFNEHAFPTALNELNQAIRIQPDNDYLYHWRGRTHWEGKNPQAALADFSKAIELRPSYVTYYHWRGLAYRKAQQYKYALEDFSKAIELQPRNGNNYWARGYTHREARNLEAAVADFGKAIRLQPNNINFYYWRGRTYLELKSPRQAWQDFMRIKEILREKKSKALQLNGAFNGIHEVSLL